jgi:hypothetical protein
MPLIRPFGGPGKKEKDTDEWQISKKKRSHAGPGDRSIRVSCAGLSPRGASGDGEGQCGRTLDLTQLDSTCNWVSRHHECKLS